MIDVPEMVCNEEPSEEEMLYFQFPEEALTMTVKVFISKNMMLYLAGFKKAVPNNWLKMHGYPMRRKRANDHRNR
jgi:hypothetical protein